MSHSFDAFVLFAEMRTGSNSLEESINVFSDLECLGELFNPTFIGHHNTFEMFGYDLDSREKDPIGFLEEMIFTATEKLPGFRLFHDHDDRIVQRVLNDHRIAKIILTRNPLASYVSRKIASATGQWRLTDMKHAKSAQIRFDAVEFRTMLNDQNAFQDRIRKALQSSGQTAFPIRYDDINDLDVLNGLAKFLGSTEQIKELPRRLKKQNASAIKDKVENYDDMLVALSDLDRFGIDTIPDLEPERSAHAGKFIAHPNVGLLFCPVKGAPERAVLDWMCSIDEIEKDALLTDLSDRDLRQWMKANPGFRSFSVVRQPLARAYDVFNRFILPSDRPMYANPRRALRQRYNLSIPEQSPGQDWDEAQQKTAFMEFIKFLQGNLAGQTSIRVDQAWASQTAVLESMAKVVVPQLVIHEENMRRMLNVVARDLEINADPRLLVEDTPSKIALDDIYDGKMEQSLIRTYRKDYQGLGYARWNRD